MKLCRIIIAVLFAITGTFFTLPAWAGHETTMNLTRTDLGSKATELNVHIHFTPGDFLYQDGLTFSVDAPHVTLQPWTSSVEAVELYDPVTQTTKKVFKQDVTLSMRADFAYENECEGAVLHMAYINAEQRFVDKTFPLYCPVKIQPMVKMAQVDTTEDLSLETAIESNVVVQQEKMQGRSKLSRYVSDLVEKTDALWLRIILVFLLGILMSLTPCIYPMIPITVGILHSHKSRTLLSNFLLSLTYTLGVATTFAILGLMAAFTGQMVGQILTNPIIVFAFIIMLTYLAGSMFGCYEMYVPRFMTQNKYQVIGGSYLSVFFFGIASGCVASPCLSPGLVLLLTIVSTLANKILGFLLLFAFGVGLSMPLLIIGTFSGALAVLPSSGMWMIEIKKFFGIILLGMNFYFLGLIFPSKYLMPFFALFLLASGIYVLGCMVDRRKKSTWDRIKILVGMLLVAASVLTGMKAWKLMYQEPQFWIADIRAAQQQAVREQKKIFLDVSAPYCGICHAIEKSLLQNATVVQELQNFVAVKLDNPNDADYKSMQQKYDIKGVPAVLVIDPATETVLVRWGSELYDVPAADLVGQLQRVR